MNQACNNHTEPDTEKLNAAMGRIRHKLLVLSGKGGVGKSTIAVNLATSLAAAGNQVGLLDIDFHGPSVPRMTGLAGQRIMPSADGIEPLPLAENLKVMSIAFLLQGENSAVIWRGPRKYGVIRQFLENVLWGDLDYLVVDVPPGTGDEPLSVAQMVGEGALAVLVTTPQLVATGDVQRCITFCHEVTLPIAGIVENMSGLVCPHCHQTVDIFGAGGGQRLADAAGVPLLGCIPLDPAVVAGADVGLPFDDVPLDPRTREVFSGIVQKINPDAPAAADAAPFSESPISE